jgi:hypothetical protein
MYILTSFKVILLLNFRSFKLIYPNFIRWSTTVDNFSIYQDQFFKMILLTYKSWLPNNYSSIDYAFNFKLKSYLYHLKRHEIFTRIIN